MKKLYYLILFTFLFFSFNINASSYVGWEHINVDSLPESSKDTMNKIYDYNSKYYVTLEENTSSEKYKVGDTFKDVYIVYPNLKTDIFNLLFDMGCTSQYNFSNCSFFRSSTNVRASLSENGTGRSYLYFIVGSNYYNTYSGNFSNCNYQNNRTLCFIDDDTLYFNSDSTFVISEIIDNIFSQNAYKSIGQSKYVWKEISYYDWYELKEVESTDYYLFYTFTDISSFNVFSWVDFTTFNDFQKITIILMVNGFYLGFIGLCIYILLKALNKLVSWLF